jgi:hypothetical protein
VQGGLLDDLTGAQQIAFVQHRNCWAAQSFLRGARQPKDDVGIAPVGSAHLAKAINELLARAILKPPRPVAVDTVFEGKRKISPTTRTRTVLIADIMMLEREAALKPAR